MTLGHRFPLLSSPPPIVADAVVHVALEDGSASFVGTTTHRLQTSGEEPLSRGHWR